MTAICYAKHTGGIGRVKANERNIKCVFMEKMKWLKSDNSLFEFNRNIISKYTKNYDDVDDDEQTNTTCIQFDPFYSKNYHIFGQ